MNLIDQIILKKSNRCFLGGNSTSDSPGMLLQVVHPNSIDYHQSHWIIHKLFKLLIFWSVYSKTSCWLADNTLRGNIISQYKFKFFWIRKNSTCLIKFMKRITDTKTNRKSFGFVVFETITFGRRWGVRRFQKCRSQHNRRPWWDALSLVISLFLKLRYAAGMWKSICIWSDERRNIR